jgi:hypothetical protein
MMTRKKRSCFVNQDMVHLKRLGDLFMTPKKMIAFYLPQFHTIPENDEWWGKGFTEWTNTRKAKPLFPDHYQPRIPLNENYYDLTDPEVMRRQAKLAQEYGIYGFCYYHYWMGKGRKLLEKPVERMLGDPAVDIHFCLCWANENWTRRWDGGANDMLMEIDYGKEDEWERHFQYLLPYFQDKRYIKMNGKPLFIIYRPHLIPVLKKMLRYFRKRATESGLAGIVFADQHAEWVTNRQYNRKVVDYNIKYEPLYTTHETHYIYWSRDMLKYKIWYKISRFRFLRVLAKKAKKIVDKIKPQSSKKPREARENGLHVEDYDEFWDFILNRSSKANRMIPGAFTDFDNTARIIKGGTMFRGSTPEKFEKYLKELISMPSETEFIFVTAWNEWAESAYLEADQKYGYAYLEAVRNALADSESYL